MYSSREFLFFFFFKSLLASVPLSTSLSCKLKHFSFTQLCRAPPLLEVGIAMEVHAICILMLLCNPAVCSFNKLGGTCLFFFIIPYLKGGEIRKPFKRLCHSGTSVTIFRTF